MFEIEDNTLVFKLLERLDKLPRSFKKDLVYSFEEEGSFFFIIYFSSGTKKGFRMYRVDDFATNFYKLHVIRTRLMNADPGNEYPDTIEEALEEISSIISSGGAGAMFYDAH